LFTSSYQSQSEAIKKLEQENKQLLEGRDNLQKELQRALEYLKKSGTEMKVLIEQKTKTELELKQLKGLKSFHFSNPEYLLIVMSS
jgi:predicted  nucleic acid-binding Zn-ribbon protein